MAEMVAIAKFEVVAVVRNKEMTTIGVAQLRRMNLPQRDEDLVQSPNVHLI